MFLLVLKDPKLNKNNSNINRRIKKIIRLFGDKSSPVATPIPRSNHPRLKPFAIGRMSDHMIATSLERVGKITAEQAVDSKKLALHDSDKCWLTQVSFDLC
jgi:hypothetical protein